ncbi:MAG: exo-alpha-sialidase [Phycisphaerae bacterium]|nr:exo-alpha-sialidase [Phycisphaerae bacterium]
MAWLGCLIGIILVSASTASLRGQASQTVPETQPAEIWGVLRTAVSDDGLHFSHNRKVFARNAAAPDLVRSPNGDLLAVFDDLSRPSKPGEPILVVSRSTDDGQTWSAPRPAIVRAQEIKKLRISHGDFVLLPNGLVRLYFHVTEPNTKDGLPGKVNFIGSAVTRNGQEYALDRRMKVGCEPGVDAHPAAIRVGAQILLHVQNREEDGIRSAKASPAVLRYTSTDGRRFRQPERMREHGLAGNMVTLRGGKYGWYISSGEDLRVLTSTDGLHWRAEPGVCLRYAVDPAVVQLKSGKFMMIYSALPGRGPMDSGEPALAAAPGSASGLAAGGPGGPSGQGTQGTTGEQPSDKPGELETAASSPADGTVVDGAGQEPAWDPFTPADPASELGDPAQAQSGGADALSPDESFAPKPDFRNGFDYCQWWLDNVSPPPGSNAYESYVSFTDTDRSGPEWQFKDRLNDGSSTGPPTPWNPVDHPDWEQSYQVSQNLLAQFRVATLDPRVQFSSATFDPNSWDADKRLLFNFTLPSLVSCRALSKAALAQGWRTENGQVSPDKVRESWETVLGNANHLQTGPTLIEGLVSVAERNLAESEARWALRQGVFSSPDQIEAALRLLQAKDAATVDMSHTLRLEHAGAMDAIQYTFSPGDADGQPQLNIERADKLLDLAGKSGQAEEIPPLTADDARAAVDAFDACFREMTEQWRTGYPTVRSGDIEATTDKYVDTNIVTKTFLPNLARAYQLQARSEASRRATQLCYEAALFNARHGRWPASLDELPEASRTQSRTDPFTGSDFGYQLGADGPTIYSKSENAADDGGVHSKNWANSAENSSDDYVFWPPQQ